MVSPPPAAPPPAAPPPATPPPATPPPEAPPPEAPPPEAPPLVVPPVGSCSLGFEVAPPNGGLVLPVPPAVPVPPVGFPNASVSLGFPLEGPPTGKVGLCGASLGLSNCPSYGLFVPVCGGLGGFGWSITVIGPVGLLGSSFVTAPSKGVVGLFKIVVCLRTGNNVFITTSLSFLCNTDVT